MLSTSSQVDTSAGNIQELQQRHEQLRAWRRWLLPLGAALLLLAAGLLLRSPARTPLTGYRYQQVGVQPDSTWWVLAYRNGQAELLVSADTSHGWQQHELHVPATQARALALNWKGWALLVGDGGSVLVLDSLLHPADSVRYPRHPFGRQFQGRWVAVDQFGAQALIVGDSGQVGRTRDGGRHWERVGVPINTQFLGKIERALFDVRDTSFSLVSRRGYYSQNSTKDAANQKLKAPTIWVRPLPNAIAWACAISAEKIRIIDKHGDVLIDNELEEDTTKFSSPLLDIAFLPGGPKEILGIDSARMFWLKPSAKFREQKRPVPVVRSLGTTASDYKTQDRPPLAAPPQQLAARPDANAGKLSKQQARAAAARKAAQHRADSVAAAQRNEKELLNLRKTNDLLAEKARLLAAQRRRDSLRKVMQDAGQQSKSGGKDQRSAPANQDQRKL